MMKQQKPSYRLGVGASSIIMIFVVLILTTLGVLAFASARSDLSLTARRQVQVSAYYEANDQAQRLLAWVDEALAAAWGDPDTFAEAVWALPEQEPALTVEEGDDGLLVTGRLPVGDTQELVFVLRILEPPGAARYDIDQWYLINIQEWKPEEYMDLSF